MADSDEGAGKSEKPPEPPVVRDPPPAEHSDYIKQKSGRQLDNRQHGVSDLRDAGKGRRREER